MKIQRSIALSACIAFAMLQATAQEPPILKAPDYNKTKRFTDLPEKQFLRLNELESLLSLSVGARVSVPVSKQFILQGTVVSVSPPADKSVKSVVIKSTNRPGTAFTFTRITENDGRFSYTGRMIGRDTGDALEITKEGDAYVLRKKAVYEIVNE
jgi:hypothetical protein